MKMKERKMYIRKGFDTQRENTCNTCINTMTLSETRLTLSQQGHQIVLCKSY